MNDLFDFTDPAERRLETIVEGAYLLRGAALPFERDVLVALDDVAARSPFRHMVTPGGFVRSVAMTNCGAAGWITDHSRYRYDVVDPESGEPWPPMPDSFRCLAARSGRNRGLPWLHARRPPD
jgi:DNA oxidative demethylase